jgi:hypothetical protein
MNLATLPSVVPRILKDIPRAPWPSLAGSWSFLAKAIAGSADGFSRSAAREPYCPATIDIFNSGFEHGHLGKRIPGQASGCMQWARQAKSDSERDTCLEMAAAALRASTTAGGCRTLWRNPLRGVSEGIAASQ